MKNQIDWWKRTNCCDGDSSTKSDSIGTAADNTADSAAVFLWGKYDWWLAKPSRSMFTFRISILDNFEFCNIPAEILKIVWMNED